MCTRLSKYRGVMVILLFTGVCHPDILPAVEIFTNRDYPIEVQGLQQQGVAFVYYGVDLPKSLTTILGNALPSNADHAKQVVQQRLTQNGNATLEPMVKSWQGLARARALGIDKLPAIVFDGKTVIYGITAMADAVAHYHRWQAQHP